MDMIFFLKAYSLSTFILKIICAYTQRFRIIFLLISITLAKEIRDDFISACIYMDVDSGAVR